MTTAALRGGFFFEASEMIKRFFLALALAAGLLGPAHASGTIPFSLSQQLDQYGKPLAGCLFYTIQAGTTSTPQNAYQDSALTIPLPNPQICDASGRLGQMFLADGTIKVRLTDKNGVTQVVADNIQVVGASSGSGGGGTVDPTTILATGDIKITYGTGSLTGFVRANGRTIGSATSGATERANADTQALFEYLWGADSNLTVSGGRGASAAADWAANKTIALPDFRGRVVAGLDDMGNSAASRLTSSGSGIDGTTLGAAGGVQNENITQSTLPSYNLATTITQQPAYTTDASKVLITNSIFWGGSNGPINVPISTGASTIFQSALAAVTVNLNGGGNPYRKVQPTIAMTYYIKL